jgi:TetR/AcrR family transcriptional repressor of mexJK operon
VLSPRHRAVLRLVIAERERFPDLAHIYWERGPQRSGQQLVTYFEALRNREVLAIDDAQEAAEFFIGMLFQRWLRPLYYNDGPPPSDLALRARAERVVARFWAAYRRGPH